MKKYGILILIIVAILAMTWLWAWTRHGVSNESMVPVRGGSDSGLVTLVGAGRDLPPRVYGSDDGPAAATRKQTAYVLRSHGSAVVVSQKEIDDIEDASARRLLGAALTPSEKIWMDKQGVPALSSSLQEKYFALPLDELRARATRGDVQAATIGGMKAGSAVFETVAAQNLREALDEDDEMSRESAVKEYLDSPEMKEQRAFWWQGAVHGSAYAAGKMALTYADPLAGCLSANLCNAWTLVAWRMGNWKLVPLSPAARGRIPEVPLYGSLAVANRLWAQLDKARAERGLPPLDLDLRPAYKEWSEMHKNPDKAMPIYPR